MPRTPRGHGLRACERGLHAGGEPSFVSRREGPGRGWGDGEGQWPKVNQLTFTKSAGWPLEKVR